MVYENAFGRFQYRHIKQEAFFGYETVVLEGAKVFLARPEKALLDLWHLSSGAWTGARMMEMRFQNTEKIDRNRLKDYAQRLRSLRLIRAANTWRQIVDIEAEGFEDI